ncbi:MAG: cysteine desulfurase-like protein [Planctomycetes bacterium]|nr:cysteine desulfurase-like protein [Planctomycetota bacterium]
MFNDQTIQTIRSQFPALARTVNGAPAVFFDGPAGSQVPQRVIDAIAEYLANCNANHAGCFATGIESDALLDEAHRAAAALFGSEDAGTVAFGQNMTSLTFALSRALARTWRAGDEIIVSRLDHDANFTPWILAAQDAGVVVRFIEVRADDCTLDLDSFRRALSPRTRLVAVGAASNAVGTVHPVAEIATAAHAVGALVFVDAVHYAAHRMIDVAAWDCDFCVCSAYKFFGPHVGLLWGRRELLESLVAYKLRPAPNELPGKWMTGTQSHEGIAGVLAAIDYLADLGRACEPAAPEPNAIERRAALTAAYQAISAYERELSRHMLTGLARLSDVRVWGITAPELLGERVSTFGLTHRRLPARELAERLAAAGVFSWAGNFYALPLTESLGLEPEGMLRLGMLHYNTKAEINRALDVLKQL